MVFGVWFVATTAATTSATPANAATARDQGASKAEALEREANALFSESSRVEEAARLFERAAELRDASDPMHFKDLEKAARLRHYLEDCRKAQKLMERSANAALDMGYLVEAARNFTDAAFFAVHASRRADADRLFERARVIAGSPLLDASQRAALTSRLQKVG